MGFFVNFMILRIWWFFQKLVKFILEKKNNKKIPLKKKLSQMNSPLNNLKSHSILNFKWQKMELSKFFTNLKLHSILDIGEKGWEIYQNSIDTSIWLELGWKVVNVVTKADILIGFMNFSSFWFLWGSTLQASVGQLLQTRKH